MRILLILLLNYLFCSFAFAAGYNKIYNYETGVGDFVGTYASSDVSIPAASGDSMRVAGTSWRASRDSVLVQEVDGSPKDYPTILNFPNASLTRNSDGSITYAAAAGGGDVTGPATNTDNNVPQWNGADSKTLKDGLAVDASGACAAGVLCAGGHTHGSTEITEADPQVGAVTNAKWCAGNGTSVECDKTIPITDVFNCSTGDCNSITTASGDLFDIREADFVISSRDMVVPRIGSVRYIASRDSFSVFGGSNVAGRISASKDVVFPLIQQKDFTIIEPDQVLTVSKDVMVMSVDSYNYPNGIVLTAFQLAISASSSLKYNLDAWSDPVGTTVSSLDQIKVDSLSESLQTSFDTATVNSGNYIVVSLDSTNVNWVKGTLWFYPKS